MFPLTSGGRMQFRGDGSPSEMQDATFEALMGALHRQGALRVERTSENIVEFDGRPRMQDYDAKLLVRIDGGRIEVNPELDGIAIQYSFSLIPAAIMAFWGSLALGVLVFLGTQAIQPLVIVLIGGWLWLTGINYIITALRFRHFVASAARAAID
jgi:hypothetical protein